jgi:hypothetical protein
MESLGKAINLKDDEGDTCHPEEPQQENRAQRNGRCTSGSNKPNEKVMRFQRKTWEWCARRDSNPHDFTHCHLKAARLPIPPRALFGIGTGWKPDRINGAM